MNDQPDQKEFTELLNFLEGIENEYSIKLMKKECDKTRKIITKLSSIAPDVKPDTNIFIAKAAVREDLLECLWTLNTHEKITA